MPRRRDVLRLGGATVAGGVATALAGCSTTDEWRTGRENHVEQWLYDPNEYGEQVRLGVEYWEPVTFERNRTYLDGEMRERLRSLHFGDPWAVDHTLWIEGEGADRPLPSVTVARGSFSVEAARSTFVGEMERVGVHEGRALYRTGGEMFAAIDHGDLLFVRNLDRQTAETYIEGQDRTFATRHPGLATFFGTVGLGANVRVELRPGGADGPALLGYAYRIDGPKTRARTIRIPGVPADAPQEVEGTVTDARRRYDALLDASLTFADGYTLLDLTMRTGAATFGTDPLAGLGV